MKKVIGLSVVAATFAMAGADIVSVDSSYDESLRAELDALKIEVDKLKNKNQNGDTKKLEDQIKKLKKQLSKIKAKNAKDNIKWGVDLRTSLDNIEYTMGDGSKRKNRDLFANRLWLNMAYTPISNVIFKGQLAYN
ncbi:MAG TPA: DUF3373 family protein, partial [Candidatus Atribacteria bacterium]|nr:DUF3373 family protein [Candidatus Atribacteria bacterium]